MGSFVTQSEAAGPRNVWAIQAVNVGIIWSEVNYNNFYGWFRGLGNDGRFYGRICIG
jgi:hypothetical protein